MTNKTKFKNYQELDEEMLRIFPNGAVEQDNHGQILIYTGLKTAPSSDGDNKLVEIGDG